MMRTYRILLIVLFSLALAGCAASRQRSGQSPDLPPPNPQEPPTEEPPRDSSKSNSPLSQIPAPTVGSVVITNTTATPVSSNSPEYSLPLTSTLEKLAQRARQDLASRLKLEIDQVGFLKIVPAKWPYDNLGCPPLEGKQVDENNPGYQILLTANGQTYTYHTDGKDWIVLCNLRLPNEIRTLP